MAAEYPTLVDLASRLDPKGEIIPIAEVLSKRDPMPSELASLNRLGAAFIRAFSRRNPRPLRSPIPAETLKCTLKSIKTWLT